MPDQPVFLPATQELAESYWRGYPPFSFRGYVAVLGEKVVGVGGVYRMAGRLWVFSAYKPEMAPFRKARARAVRLLLQLVDTYPEPVYAVRDENEPTAATLLPKLGFVPSGEEANGQPVLVRSK